MQFLSFFEQDSLVTVGVCQVGNIKARARLQVVSDTFDFRANPALGPDHLIPRASELEYTMINAKILNILYISVEYCKIQITVCV